MSKDPQFIMVRYEVFTDRDLSPAEKLLFSRIEFYAGADGFAYPKHETLAREMCMDERQVRRLLENLRDLNRITWRRTRTSCVYRLKLSSEWTKMSDQDRTEMSSLTGQKCPIKSGHKCPTEKKYRKSSSKRGSEKTLVVEQPARPDAENQSTIPLKADDEPATRAEHQNPEMEFRQRLIERGHDIAVSVDSLLRDIKGELDSIPLEDFLAADKTATTGRLRNPAGHYRALARKLARKGADSINDSLEAAQRFLRVEQARHKPAACCKDGKRQDGGFCDCRVGVFAKELKSRQDAQGAVA